MEYKNYITIENNIENNILLRVNNDITKFIIPDNITEIASNCFSCCYNLVSVEIPNSVTIIRISSFYKCKSLSKIIIPKSVSYIECLAFKYCENLKFISISNSNTFIQDEAFDSTPFENIFKKLGSIRFIKFLNEKDKLKYIGINDLILEDISFLLDEKEFKGYTNGVNYGI